MADEPPQRKTITIGFWDKLTNMQKLLLVVIIIFPFYVAFTTTKVPNYQCRFPNGTTYYPLNPIEDVNCGLLYKAGDYVPKNNMSYPQALLLAILILALFFSLITKKELGRIPIPIAINLIKEDLKKIQSLPSSDGNLIPLKGKQIELGESALTRYRDTPEGWKPFRYTIGMKVIDKNINVEHYYKAMFHPMDGFLDGYVPTIRQMEEWDLCPKCGKEYDIAGITKREIEKLGEIRRGISGQT